MNVNRELLAFLRKQYPVGTRIRLDSMQDPYAPVEAGTTGKLDYIDDAGQFHMKWDNGRVLALIPGTSRSGSTIIGGLLCGMSRACASQFTFFLAIPVMAGASGLKLVKFLAGGGVFTVGEIGALLVGCIVAFVVSILAIRFLMDYVKKHTFTAFGWYRIALGIVVLGVWALQTFVLV